MSIRGFWNRLAGRRRRAAIDTELAEEMAEHLRMAEEANVAAGMTPERARHEARRAFGNVGLARQVSREAWNASAFDILAGDLLADVRYAFRSLRRSPSFTIAAVLALGLGIGSATGVFSTIEGVVLRPLPYHDPGQLVTLWEANPGKALDRQPLSPVNFVDYRGLTSVFQDAAAWWRPELNLTDDATSDAIRVSAVETSQNLFRVLGVQPAVGRDFGSDTTLDGNVQEAVISDRLWQSRFGRDRSVLGKAVKLNGYVYTIVGVMPSGFAFPGQTDLWEGLVWKLTEHSRGAHFMGAVARLRPGVTPDRANTALRALTERLGNDFAATNRGWSARVVPLDWDVVGAFRPGLLALFGATGLLLLIACMNVANLILARATVRGREVAVRAAIGASRLRLLRLFFTEHLVLAAAGAVLGAVIAVATVRGFLLWAPIAIPRADSIGIDGRVLLFAMGVTLLTALVFGLVPAYVTSNSDLQEVLKTGGRGVSQRSHGTRGLLVAGEVAVAVVLLCGAGVLMRSVSGLLNVPTGLDPTAVTTVSLQLPDVAYKDWSRVDLFYTRLLQALRARPEIAGAGVTEFLPLATGWRLPFGVVGATPVAAADLPQAQFHSVDEGYFATLRTSLVRGRMLQRDDDATSPGVVLVNEALAHQLWPDGDAVGKHLIIEEHDVGPLGSRIVHGNDHQIVGVVADVKNASLTSVAEPALYFSMHQFPFRKTFVVVRSSQAPAALETLLRDEVRAIDPTIPLGEVAPMTRVLGASVDAPRFVMMILGVFAVLALGLAAVGIYGLLMYTVTHRRREIGIRLALGARPGDVLRMLVREGLSLTIIGGLTGVLVARLASTALSSLLYRVSPWDPATVCGVLAGVLLVAAGACLIPGRRAAHQDPMTAIRAE